MHNQAREAISFITVELLVLLSAFGLAGVVTLSNDVVLKAVKTGLVAFCTLLVYIGLTAGLRDTVDGACAKVEPFLSTDAALNALNMSLPPASLQFFQRCLNDELSLSQLVGPTDFLNANIDASIAALQQAIPNSAGIIYPDYSQSSSSAAAPNLDRMLKTVSSTLVQLSTYINTEYASKAAASGWAGAATDIAPLSRRLSQLECSVTAIESVLGLLDCSALNQLIEDMQELFCTDVKNQLSYMFGLQVFIMVVLAISMIVLMSHGVVTAHPARHYRCPNVKCGRWFRFKMCMEVG